MANIGSLKKSGTELQGEIVTLSFQANGRSSVKGQLSRDRIRPFWPKRDNRKGMENSPDSGQDNPAGK